jgi:von Willebrand factor type A domain
LSAEQVRTTRRNAASVSIALAALGLFACGGSDHESVFQGAGVGTSGAGGSGTGQGSGVGGSGSPGGSSGTGASGTGTGGSVSSGSGGGSSGGHAEACSGLPLDTAPTPESCVGVAYEAESVPVDIYVMMDRSVSMTETLQGGTESRWNGVRTALQQFIEDQRAGGMGVGIQFFGQSSGRDDAIDCDVSRYATPRVGIGLLPGNGTALMTALQDTIPGGFTPTGPALAGAVQQAKTWAAHNAGRATFAVLVTDGFPTQCEPRSVGDIADIARQAAETEPRIHTYVIGLAGDLNLDQIARAGGTRSPFLISQGDVAGPFLEAMLNITQSSVTCEFKIPDPPSQEQQVDLSAVQVVYTPAAGQVEEIPRAAGIQDCANATNGGWYYDNPVTPTKISVCPCTCSRFAAGRVDVRLGCKPREVIIR